MKRMINALYETRDMTEESMRVRENELTGLCSEQDEIKAQMLSQMSAEAQALVAKLQAHITENYYTCTDELLAGLGRMYVADERFKKNIDKYGKGTAEFVAEAIAVYGRKA